MEFKNIQSIFSISNSDEFETQCLRIFDFQFSQNPVYKSYCELLGKNPKNISDSSEIPFLPIEFFKSKEIVSFTKPVEVIFESSGTTGSTTSKHFIPDLNIYRESFTKAFTLFLGAPEKYCILALLPSYLERKGSSLVFMVDDLIHQSQHPDSGFYLYDVQQLHQKLIELEEKATKTLLIGVSFALLDLAEQYPMNLKHTKIMETGGMKGRRKEMIREELHYHLKKAFGTDAVYSEYGMTELLSQAYSLGKGTFDCPPWMKVLTRDTEDPLSPQDYGKTGGINIIDLANVYSCSFIATQDLGKVYPDGSFEVLGRFDHSDVRGCNLMAL
ncbi:acyl transferase [Flagellimonas meridianipacifica]|uniref:Acyl-protein synthetase LuxE n=1 Tax=Flagellimonas meridianipacifica TaxID=1080225 RepID=A0A2T0MG28_9FLAO|nr:acyl transferase [Allomuricauda pacifica]PRX56530.1 acyl-protein synthetase LuxE [Allomuricauda pacifica]